MTKEELTGIIKSRIASYLGCSTDSIKENSTLGHIGLDSLDCVQLEMDLEQILNTDLIEVQCDENLYLSDLIDKVFEATESKK